MAAAVAAATAATANANIENYIPHVCFATTSSDDAFQTCFCNSIEWNLANNRFKHPITWQLAYCIRVSVLRVDVSVFFLGFILFAFRCSIYIFAHIFCMLIAYSSHLIARVCANELTSIVFDGNYTSEINSIAFVQFPIVFFLF